MSVKLLRAPERTPPQATREVHWAPERHPTRPWETYGPVHWDPSSEPPRHRTVPYFDLEAI